jgi:hypothetical protein
VRHKRWQVVVGALAVAAVTTMYLLSRDGDSAAAAIARPPVGREQPAPQITVPRVAPEPRATPIAPSDAIRPVITPVAATAPIQHGSRTPARAPHLRTEFHPAGPRQARVTPHRALPLDPDGTIDPY